MGDADSIWPPGRAASPTIISTMNSVAAKPHHRKQLNHFGAQYDNEYVNMFNDSPFGIAVATGSCI
jgi:hypothetical protein